MDRWRGQYNASNGQPLAWPLGRAGLAGLTDKPRPDGCNVNTRRDGSDASWRRWICPPPAGFARWTGALIAAELGDVHEQQVWRVLRAQRVDLGGRSRGARAMIRNSPPKRPTWLGSYMAPPENATGICVAEKPSIQALERPQGYLSCPTPGR